MAALGRLFEIVGGGSQGMTNRKTAEGGHPTVASWAALRSAKGTSTTRKRSAETTTPTSSSRLAFQADHLSGNGRSGWKPNLLAGGGIKRGFSYGESDDFAYNPAKDQSTSTTSKRRCCTASASTTNASPTDFKAATFV